MGEGGRVKFVVVGAVLFLSLTKVALSYAQSSPGHSGKDVQVWDIAIPRDLGYVLETHQADRTTASHPGISHPGIIVHIQDAHTNYEAQQSIVRILEQLIQQHGLKLILVEGSEGDASLTYLRRYGPPENRKHVAEKYLKAGIISAEEYLDIVSDYPLTLWGVEQQTLYDQNVEAFLTAESLQESLKPLLSAVHEAVGTLRPKLSDPALTDLEAKAKAYEQHTLSLTDYVVALAAAAKRLGMSLETAPHVQQFLEVHRLEQAMALPRVQQEQQALIGALTERANEEKLEELVAKANGMKEGTVKPAAFYALLADLANASTISLETSYPNLSRYVRYVTQSARMEPTSLAKDVDACSANLRRRLAATPESRQLSAIADEADLLEKLLDLRLSPEEYHRLTVIDLRTIASRWSRFLNEQLARYGMPAQSFQPLHELEAQLPTLQRFYEVAQQRDEILVQNAIAKLQETKEPLAVLITGGFHSPKITQMLKDQGLGTVVLTPKVSQPTNERLYRAVVKYKSGRGSFEDVMAIANSTGDATGTTNTGGLKE